VLGSLAKTPSPRKAGHLRCSPPTAPTARPNIAQGWVVPDPRCWLNVGPVPAGEAIIEIPEDVLKFYARNYSEEER
jgi:hypothetical protein